MSPSSLSVGRRRAGRDEMLGLAREASQADARPSCRIARSTGRVRGLDRHAMTADRTAAASDSVGDQPAPVVGAVASETADDRQYSACATGKSEKIL